MENPVLIEVLRGAVVESRHRGAVSVVDGDGKPVLTVGDVDRPVFPRSAIKAIQALPLVESGAADTFMFGNRELALACASHSGEDGHVETARTMLARAGLAEEAFECGSHWPFYQSTLIEFAGQGKKPLPVHNNCSGKHAGFLCFACHENIDTGGYVALALALRYLKEEGIISTDPLSAQVAAVSCGIFGDTPVLDLDYPEDSAAQVDANFVMASDQRLIEIQGTGEQRAFSRAEFNALMDLAEAGCGHLFAAQRKALGL